MQGSQYQSGYVQGGSTYQSGGTYQAGGQYASGVTNQQVIGGQGGVTNQQVIGGQGGATQYTTGTTYQSGYQPIQG